MYTCTFFVSGIAACLLGGTLPALGIASEAPKYAALEGAMRVKALALLATSVAGTAAFSVVADKTKRKAVSTWFDGFAGLMFGVGLCLSGMTRPTLVRPHEQSVHGLSHVLCACDICQTSCSAVYRRLFASVVLHVQTAV